MSQEPISAGEGDTPDRAAVSPPPAGTWWRWRSLLLGPVIVQLTVAFSLYRDLRAGTGGPAILAPLAFLHLAGAIGILAGVLSRLRSVFFLGLACTALGVAVPITMSLVAVPITKDTSSIPGLGSFDAEGLGTLMFLRLLFELPFWVLYGAIVAYGYVRARRAGKRVSTVGGGR